MSWLKEAGEIFKWSVGFDLYEWAKISVIGDVALGASIVNALTWLTAKYKGWPVRWQYRLQGTFCAFVFLTCVSAGDFLYQRFSTDPREIPADQITAFKAALPVFNADEVVNVECFRQDPSSCRIAQWYYNLFADYWGVKPMSASCVTPNPNAPDVKGRVWVTTASEIGKGKGPPGAVDLHRALDKFGLNPGYRVCRSFGPNEFGFTVGVRPNGKSN